MNVLENWTREHPEKYHKNSDENQNPVQQQNCGWLVRARCGEAWEPRPDLKPNLVGPFFSGGLPPTAAGDTTQGPPMTDRCFTSPPPEPPPRSASGHRTVHINPSRYCTGLGNKYEPGKKIHRKSAANYFEHISPTLFRRNKLALSTKHRKRSLTTCSMP